MQDVTVLEKPSQLHNSAFSDLKFMCVVALASTVLTT